MSPAAPLALLAAVALAACAAPAAPPPAPLPPSPPLAPLVVAPAAAAEPSAEATTPVPPAAPPPAPPPPPPRLTSQAATSWIYAEPKASGRTLGYLRTGSSVALRSPDRTAGEGCSGGFYAVEPRGYVCDDHTVTLAPSARFAALVAATAPVAGPLPYRYALSDGAPMYARIPTPEEQLHAERALGPADSLTRPRKRTSTYDDLASTDAAEPAAPAPSFLESGDARPVRETLPRGSMLSFTRVFSAAGRTFLLSTDHTLVPADRVRLFRASSFHGVRLGADVELPLAWLRRVDRPQYRLLPSGALEKTGGTWPAKSYVRLTGAEVGAERRRFHETRDHDAAGAPLYIAGADASVVEPASKVPIGVKPTQKWIVVHLSEGTLVAYEGLRPVYTTLMSPGRGGVPVAGRDPVEASTTPLGVFYVTFKDRATTMTHDKPGEPRTHWIADVPFTQYFDPPFALHAAYWHDRFGEETSAGCINVSPTDAEVLFEWSDPKVPEGWQGATGSGAPENGATTAVVVRR
jgi:hypothetical protein